MPQGACTLCPEPVALTLQIQQVAEGAAKKMPENSATDLAYWEALYQRERYREPIRELSAGVDRHFQWDCANSTQKIPIKWLEHYARCFHFSDDEIRAARTASSMPQASGVYFLFRGDVCIYVGQSQNFAARAEQHERNGFEWTSHTYIEVPKFHAPAVEAYYIRRLSPPLNGYIPRLSTYFDIVKKLGLDRAS
ncbi:hypothetical protein IM543_11445 [Massilia sp. UMI-21]|nr:hypothetical protein IM543_11445 [Massilia sp. UMI-21]